MSLILEKAIALAKKIQTSSDPNATEDIATIAEALQSFPAYFTAVTGMPVQARVAALSCRGEEYRSLARAADTDRTRAHDRAIISVNLLNRLARYYGAEDIFPTGHDLDPTCGQDRASAATIVYQFCVPTYREEAAVLDDMPV